ncbi:MAG: flagellar protein FlgN [Clostridiaceae bacterium]|nr:flagellar protein FlgN [Clostridiaceae bacterium]
MLDLSPPVKLLSIFEKEAELYSKFLDLSRQKTEVLINGDVRELENITKNELVLIESVGELEETREQAVSEIACGMGVEASSLTISSIIDNLDKAWDKGWDKAWAEKLKKARANILCTIEEIRKTNMRNKVLIDASLEYIDFSLNLLSSTNDKGINYSRDGKEGNSEKLSLFDVKL